jgi:hypothetical protein
MPILLYFAAVGSTLVGLLFVADAMLPSRGPLGISTEFHGVQAAMSGETPVAARASAPAPEPDMKSEAVKLARQGAPEPNVKPDGVKHQGTPAPAVNLEPVNSPVASAEPAAPKKRKPVARPREPRDQVARPREWRDRYAQAPDFGWNGGSDGGWRNDFGRNDTRRNDHWRNDSWRNDSWRNEPWRNDRRGRWDGQ